MSLRYLSSVIRQPIKLQSSFSTLWASVGSRQVVPRSQLSVRFFSDTLSSQSVDAWSHQGQQSTLSRSEMLQEEQRMELGSYGPMPPTPAEVNSDHLTQEDVDLYLKPLYARKWRVRLYTQDALMKSSKNTLYLAKLFKFMDFRVATRFVDDIASIALAEKHHPEIYFRSNHVWVRLQTHRPNPTAPAPDADRSTQPTITQRDIRLAILTERCFVDDYLVDQKGGRATGTPITYWTPETIEEVEGIVDGYLRFKALRGAQDASNSY